MCVSACCVACEREARRPDRTSRGKPVRQRGRAGKLECRPRFGSLRRRGSVLFRSTVSACVPCVSCARPVVERLPRLHRASCGRYCRAWSSGEASRVVRRDAQLGAMLYLYQCYMLLATTGETEGFITTARATAGSTVPDVQYPWEPNVFRCSPGSHGTVAFAAARSRHRAF